MKIADAMLIGGGMAYTFLKADGQPIGKSLVENDKLDLARRLREEAQKEKFALLLPSITSSARNSKRTPRRKPFPSPPHPTVDGPGHWP